MPRLTERDKRTILSLRCKERLSYALISDRTGIPRHTVASCVRRHKKRRDRKRDGIKPSIYFIFAVGTQYVKIGWAIDPEARRTELQPGCPHVLRIVATIPDQTPRDEATLHERFKDYHCRGEWFYFDGELLTYVHELRGGVRHAAASED